MPELPDVEVLRRHAAATSLHKAIERVHVHEKRLLDGIRPQTLGKELSGKEFKRTLRHGKYLLLETGNQCLVLHFGTTGGLEFINNSNFPSYTQVEFHFQDNSCLAYTSRRLLGHIFVVTNRDELVKRKELGPDALDLAADSFLELFLERKGHVKSALMDQSLIAGIGNI